MLVGYNIIVRLRVDVLKAVVSAPLRKQESGDGGRNDRLIFKNFMLNLDIIGLLLGVLRLLMAAVAEWSRYRIVAGFVTSSSPVPIKTHRVGQRCSLNLSRAETSSRWWGGVVRRGGASSDVVHVT
ncbi:uncharacterized protein TNCV_1273051 [Trichonephila clavipes]|nr:uncharacterized protein TNCV_1273051 [Trichonephila clavipes]